MKSIRDFFILLLFFILMTYFVMFFKRENDSAILDSYEKLSQIPHNGRYFVVRQEKEVSLKLPMEHYLVGALAASIPIDYEKEVLKAQAIVLRSTLYTELKEQNCLFDGSENADFWTDRQMQSAWGDLYETNLQKCVDAVVETQGIYLSYMGKPVSGFYHGMSAGKTRSAKELSGNGEYGYLKETVCADNLSALDFEQITKISADKVGKLGNAQTSEAGYVISVERNGELISGQKLRNDLRLASTNVTWEKEGDHYIFTTRGKGHGFGLDQYYGNVLAQKGMDYREIVDYFFADVTYERVE